MNRLKCAAALALFGLASSAQAQLAPGYSGFSSAPTTASEAEYWTMMRRLGACLADSKTQAATAFLQTEPGSKAEDEAFAPLFHRHSNRCMGNFVSASMQREHIRGLIAESLFEQMPAGQRPAVVEAANDVEGEQIRTLHQFGQCYVSDHPQEAIAFLNATKVGTKGEVQAIRQMATQFGPCLPDGVEVKIVPVDIRMAIAEALFHAASTPQTLTNQVSK